MLLMRSKWFSLSGTEMPSIDTELNEKSNGPESQPARKPTTDATVLGSSREL